VGRHSHRDQVTGRFQKIDPERDLAPVNVSGEDAYAISDNSIGSPVAPTATDAPPFEPLHPRSRIYEYGLRDPFGRVDQHLVERAQAGTSLVPGNE
jgi:hypothetical protein